MKYDIVLKQQLMVLAEYYGKNTFGNDYAHPNEFKNSSVIFKDIKYSFQKESWNAILSNAYFSDRTKKSHPKSQTKGVFEMQSSNSSDALAMNIFCHPNLAKSKEISKLFNVNQIKKICFGYKAKINKTVNNAQTKDNTEIDILINDSIFIECKLTEKDFTSKNKNVVEQYTELQNVFHIDKLIKTETSYKNYQLIRNIIAAYQYNGRFILLCDKRRPDLVESFHDTVSCIIDNKLKKQCSLIYWQDLTAIVGGELEVFLKLKYGLKQIH